MTTKIKIEGLKGLKRALNTLPDSIGRRVTRQALMAGAKPIQKEAQALAPADSGNLKKNILRKSLKLGRRRGNTNVAVGVGPSKKIFYGFFQEFGTAHQNGTPFLLPAFESKATEAERIVASRLKSGILRQARRLKNK